MTLFPYQHCVESVIAMGTDLLYIDSCCWRIMPCIDLLGALLLTAIKCIKTNTYNSQKVNMNFNILDAGKRKQTDQCYDLWFQKSAVL